MPTFNKLPEMSNFDGFDSKSKYQMVPVQGKRDMGIITESSEVVLYSSDPSIARFANFRSYGGAVRNNSNSEVPDSVTLPPHSRIAFSVMGINVGHTTIVLEGNKGVADPNSSSLLISVKGKIRKTYAICRVKDIRRSTRRSYDNAKLLMKRAEQTFLQQANVELRESGSGSDVLVMRDLGNPIKDVRGACLSLIDVTPRWVKDCDIVVYCVWDLWHMGGVTASSKPAFAFVADEYDDNQSGFIFAHEVGHALGLGHNGNVQFLMFKTTAMKSSKLAQFEIDTINPSGTVP